MEPTTAVIQFIGIILFSASIPNDPGIHAILPRIGHAEGVHSPGHNPQDPDKSFVDGVEDHVAAIIYRKEDRLSNVGGWQKDGTMKNGWEYVLLDGERVQFLTNGVTNGEPEVPSSLPHAGGAPVCRKFAPPELQPEFLKPYKGAIGVFDIPTGFLDTCEANSFQTNTNARVDTRLIIETEGILVIAAKKAGERGKTISLDEDAVVYVVNVPPEFVLTGTENPGHGGAPHWDAYNDMFGKSCAVKPETVDEVIQECDLSNLSEAYNWARKYKPFDWNLINSECSNAQTP